MRVFMKKKVGIILQAKFHKKQSEENFKKLVLMFKKNLRCFNNKKKFDKTF